MKNDLVEGLLAGDRRALARLITRIESGSVDVTAVMARVFPSTGRAVILGFTGPPGAGKSTLVDRVIAHYRARDKTVGVVAVDPSSPFSGGALLGDRIRMNRHAGDAGVFIRSLGTRGFRGGLSRSTRNIIRLMDAAGFDTIIVETVGVGQTELDIMEVAGTTVVVLVPESGDVVQTMKAGLTEIADIFVINKADRSGADVILRELAGMVELNPPSPWTVPVLKTQAIKGTGVEELCETIERHSALLAAGKIEARRKAPTAETELAEILAGRIEDGLRRLAEADTPLSNLIRATREGGENPYAAAEKIVSRPELLSELFSERPPRRSQET